MVRDWIEVSSRYYVNFVLNIVTACIIILLHFIGQYWLIYNLIIEQY